MPRFPSISTRPALPIVPASAPAWVDGELLALTIRVWQPYYQAPLTPEDALAMLLGTAQLLGVVTTRR